MDKNQDCQPPSSTLTFGKQYMGDYQNLKMVGTVKDKKEDVLEITYQGSNKFWDESDIFSVNGETILVYLPENAQNIQIGEKVLVQINGMYWDLKHERNVGNGNCLWTMSVLSTNKIEPYTFDYSIEATEAVQSYFLPSMFFLAAFVTIFALFISRKRKKKTHH